MKQPSGSDGRSLLSRWKDRSTSQTPTIEPRTADELLPLSTGQQRLYFLQNLHPGNPFYNYADIYHFSGDLDVDLLLEALSRVVAKHKILHTKYTIVEGHVRQHVQIRKFECLDQDLTNLLEQDLENEIALRLSAYATESFDLAEGPLMRAVALRTRRGCSVLLNMHHIVMDKWSMRLLREQWAEVYVSLTLGETKWSSPSKIDYLDYALWEQKQSVKQKQLAYWKKQLSGEIPKLDLPHDYLRAARPTFKGSFSRRELDLPTSRKLQQTAADLGCTLFVLLLAAFKLVMSRYGDQKDVLVGTPVTNRDQPALEDLVGFFNDTVVLRSQVIPNATFRHFVQEVKKTVLDAFANKQVSFGEVIKGLDLARDDGRNPLFQIMFLYHDVPSLPSFAEDVEVHHEPFDLGVSKFDLTLYIENRKGKLTLIHEYSTELFEPTTIHQFEESLVHVLNQLVTNPQRELGQFSLLTERQTRTIVHAWNDTSYPLEDQPGILNQIKQHAIAKPDAVCAYADGVNLTYEALNRQSHNIASVLKGYVESNQKIGLCVSPSSATVLGIVGILKAGCAYVPLDPSYPDDRLRFMAEDSQMTMLLTSRSANYGWSDLKVLFIEDLVEEDLSDESSLIAEEALDLAYLIYTSGSSGRPKGVMVTNENLKYSTIARTIVYEDVPKTFLLMSSFSFDSSVAGIFWTLIAGGRLIMAARRQEQDIEALQALIREQKVTHTLMLPSLYQLLLEFGDSSQLSSLQCVIVAGEACSRDLVQLHVAKLPGTRLYNEYGPTEATVWCTVQELGIATEAKKVAIGKPIPNAKAYIVNADLRPAPPGSAGELLIGGKGLTPGYFRREDLTRQRFISNPFVPGERLYRTGDRARFRSNGIIDFLGRIDDQVKIRGYRIEPSEVAETIGRYEGVDQAVVVTPKDEQGRARLKCYFVASKMLNISDLRDWLKESLPGYMVPDEIHRIESMPLLPNGKLDQQSLKALEIEEVNVQRSEEASALSEREQQLARIWAEVLGKENVGVDQNFFSIGGDSIKSIQIIAKARAEGLKIAPDLIFRQQTIADMAEAVEELIELKIDQGEGRGQMPWSPIQHWFFEEHQAAPQYWNQAQHIVLRNAMPKTRITLAVDQLVQHHDNLRLGFLEDGSAQYIAGHIKRTTSVNQKPLTRGLQELQKSFQLDSGNLFQVLLYEDEPGLISELVLVAHHLIVDALSWGILLDDLHTILDASPLALKVQLPLKTNSYQDWTIAMVAQASELPRDLSWWKEQVDVNVRIPSKAPVQLPILEKDIKVSHLIMDRDFTDRISGKDVQAMRISTEEILLLAFYRAWRTWSSSETLNLLLERHGRDLDPDIDLSRSVGWFTSFFPFKLDLSAATSIGAEISRMKELREEIPNKGRDFGVLRYLLQESMDYHWSQVVFNFLGTINPHQRPLFKKIDFLMEGLRDPASERSYLLEVNLGIEEGQLHTSVSYAANFLNQYEIEKLLGAFDGELAQIVDFCENSDGSGLQASDFPEAGLSQEGLDNLLDELT